MPSTVSVPSVISCIRFIVRSNVDFPILSGEISLVLDPNELVDERGTLYTDESLTHAFIAGYAEYLFNSSSQIDYETLANEEGVPYGYLNRGYKADSYLAMYMDEFGLEVDPEAGYYDEYWQLQDIVAEMSGNLAAYITGASGDDQDTAKLDFFAAFPAFQAMKTFEGGL